jgi:hypothetical protein
MSLQWQPKPIEVYIEWCRMLYEEASDDLNSWEIGFVESVYGRLVNGNNLTELQAEKLEKIYSEKTK